MGLGNMYRYVCVLALIAKVSAQAAAPAGGAGASTNGTSSPCNWSNLCPSTKPCCGQYGTCGTGTTCLSGCNPLGSTSVGYCAPVPICQNMNYTFTSMDRIADAATYNGDATAYDWTLEHQDSKNDSMIQNGQLALILTQAGGGTRLSTTRNILYGNIEASIKTTSAVGVVTAFITMSGVKDEIDWEWTASNMSEAQTNYYWEGDVNNYENGGKAIAANRASQFHTYGINWQSDQLQWLVDGKVVRTLTRQSTYDSSSGLYKYPQTPSRIEISVWPAGISSSAQGTIDWAGGLINWSDASYVSQGYFAAYVQYISVTCNTPSNMTFQAGNSTNSTSKRSFELWERQTNINSFIYGTNNSQGQVQLFSSNAGTVINSDTSTGMNMQVAKSEVKPIGSNSSIKSCNGNWWCEQKTITKIGIIIGGVVVFLFALIFVCTCWHRRKNAPHNLKAAAASFPNANQNRVKRADFIPLVDTKYETGPAPVGSNGGAPSRFAGGTPTSPYHQVGSAYAPSLGYQQQPNYGQQQQYEDPFNRYDENAYAYDERRTGSASPAPYYSQGNQSYGSKIHHQGY